MGGRLGDGSVRKKLSKHTLCDTEWNDTHYEQYISMVFFFVAHISWRQKNMVFAGDEVERDKNESTQDVL